MGFDVASAETYKGMVVVGQVAGGTWPADGVNFKLGAFRQVFFPVFGINLKAAVLKIQHSLGD